MARLCEAEGCQNRIKQSNAHGYCIKAHAAEYHAAAHAVGRDERLAAARAARALRRVKRFCEAEGCENEIKSWNLYGYCTKAHSAEYHAAHYAANREQLTAYKAQYWAANEERLREAGRAWNAANRERKAEMDRAWRAANKERVAANLAAYAAAHREQIAAYLKEYYQDNAEHLRAQAVASAAANPDRVHAAGMRRRVRVAGQHTDDYKKTEVFARDEGICHLCGEEVEGTAQWRETGRIPPGKCWNIEHVVPITLGGIDGWDNVAVSHPIGSCNSRPREAASFFLDILQTALTAYETFHGKPFTGRVRWLGDPGPEALCAP